MSLRSRRQGPKNLNSWAARTMPYLFVAVGAGMTAFGGIELYRAKASAKWPTARGTVVESKVESRQRTGKRRGTSYHAKIAYRFDVAGKTFRGERVALGDYGSSDESHARGIVQHYPTGKNVTVHYNPENPEVCLLEPGLKPQAWLVPGGGLIFVVAGVGFAGVLARARRNLSSPAEPAERTES